VRRWRPLAILPTTSPAGRRWRCRNSRRVAIEGWCIRSYARGAECCPRLHALAWTIARCSLYRAHASHATCRHNALHRPSPFSHASKRDRLSFLVLRVLHSVTNQPCPHRSPSNLSRSSTSATRRPPTPHHHRALALYSA
jgi:hypothetical protein